VKFSRLGAAHSHRRGGREEANGTTLEPFIKPVAHRAEIHTYAELRQQIHDDLRIQHPEWVNPNGESPMCDVYEARLTETLEKLTRRGSNDRLEARSRRLRTWLRSLHAEVKVIH
jgi:hypothetical protein